MTLFANYIISLAGIKKLKGVIITGAGKAFSAGGDLKWASAYSAGPSSALHELSSRFHQAITEIRKLDRPVIAAVNGIAAGGGFSLALACDFRIMTESAVLKQGYTSSGLSLDGGGSYSLPRLVGISKAMEIISFDELIDADNALKNGLTFKVVKENELMQEAEELINRINKISLSSFASSKHLLNNSFNTSFETQLENERTELVRCAADKDGIEGVSAFIEKRTPKFNQ